MKNTRIANNENGQGVIEYALLLALIALAVIIVLILVNNRFVSEPVTKLVNLLQDRSAEANIPTRNNDQTSDTIDIVASAVLIIFVIYILVFLRNLNTTGFRKTKIKSRSKSDKNY